MPIHCCVPECNQKGVKSPTGEKVSFFEFPNQPLLRKRHRRTGNFLPGGGGGGGGKLFAQKILASFPNFYETVEKKRGQTMQQRRPFDTVTVFQGQYLPILSITTSP